MKIKEAGEYILVPVARWDEFSTAMLRHHGFTYSIEDGDGDGIEYHVHGHLEEAEDVLWAMTVLSNCGISAVELQSHLSDFRR